MGSLSILRRPHNELYLMVDQALGVEVVVIFRAAFRD